MSTDSTQCLNDDLEAQFNEVAQELHALLEYSPPTLTLDPSLGTPCTRLPFWIYDKHLDEKLKLLRVRSLSTILESLAARVDDALKSITERSIRLPLLGSSYMACDWRRRKHPVVTNTRSVALFYQETLGSSCSIFAPMPGIHPRAPSWMLPIFWDMIEYAASTSCLSSWLENLSLRVKYDVERKLFFLPSELEECLGGRMMSDLENVVTRLPDLATWLIGPVSSKAEAILLDMDRVIMAHDFRFRISSTTGHAPTTSVLIESPPDATLLPRDIDDDFINNFQQGPSKRPLPERAAVGNWPRRGDTDEHQKALPTYRKKSDAQEKTNPAAKVDPQFIVSPGVKAELPSDTERLLQHAWIQSVRKDTSFIIFHCGNFERIGFHHRKSQTLYLSDLIDVAHDKDPSYGKLHLGLFIAALRDTLDRAPQLGDLDVVPPLQVPDDPGVKTLKRKAADALDPTDKRARTKTGATSMSTEISVELNNEAIFQKAGLRNLALFHFQYGVYNSMSSSSFLRVEHTLWPSVGPTNTSRLHRKYLPHQYFTVYIFSPIGDGATGVAHKAKLELNTSDSHSVSCDAVVKLAFTVEQQERLRHEYSIYAHMAAAGVQGAIVGVLGLLHDLEGGPLALIMTHGGEPLEDSVDAARGRF